MDLDRLVFDVGDEVTGWGRLVEDDGTVWFDPPHTVNLMWTGEPPQRSRYAVRLHGADPAAVATDWGPPGGAIPGCGTVTGSWLGDAVEVRSQSPNRPARPAEPSWTIPPCPPPPDGWPDGVNGRQDENLEFDIGDLQRTGSAVTVVQFSPGPDQRVLVVAATDEAAVERQLRPQLGSRLCVVPSRWTRAQLDEACAGLREHWRDWTIDSIEESVDDGAQPSVRVNVFRVVPGLDRWARGLPAGLLRAEPALVPTGS